jgi:hypothetical protein
LIEAHMAGTATLDPVSPRVPYRGAAIALSMVFVGTLNEQLAFASWAAWALPLVITEAVLQGRKILAVKPV